MAYHVIGDAETILGFGFAGVPGTAVDSMADAKKAFSQLLTDQSLSVLVVTYPVATMLEKELTEHRLASRPPYVVEIPDLWDTPVERKTLVELIQEAVGIKITGSD